MILLLSNFNFSFGFGFGFDGVVLVVVVHLRYARYACGRKWTLKIVWY
jgi:hypothetical protein